MRSTSVALLTAGAAIGGGYAIDTSSSPVRRTEGPLSQSSYVCPLRTSLRLSHVSSFKKEGYYRLADVKQIHIDDAFYEMRTMRGSGPGGQGTNSSSNKVELRLDLELLSLSFDEDIIENIRRQERLEERQSEKNANLLIVSSHEHRSALQNKETCLARVKEIVRRASWVPPVEADPIQTPSRRITQEKNERRKKSNMSRMRRSARRGTW